MSRHAIETNVVPASLARGVIAIDTLEAIRGRRSIRRFKPDPIPLDVLEEVIDAGRWAPYGTAHDGRVLRVMTGAEKAGLVDFLARRLEEVIPVLAESAARQTLSYARSLVDILRDAPVVVSVFVAVGPEGAELSIASAACAVENIMLAAYAHGLGACYLTGSIYLADEIAHLWGLDGFQLVGMVPLGYPADGDRPRREFPTVLWRGFGAADHGETPTPPETPISDVERARPGEGERVLIVTDDIEVDKPVISVLRRAGYEVITADPDHALDAYHSSKPHVTIVDAILSGISGYSLARAINEATEGPSPVLIMTAAYDATDEEQALIAGASDIISKPVRSHELLARVRFLADSLALYERLQQHAQQLEQVNEELRRLQRMRDDLTHMIVHDMRTPLTNIITGLQTVEAADYDPALTRELLPEAIRAGEDLADMVNNLLDISKMEAGELVLRREEVAVRDVVSEAIERVRYLAEEKKQQLATDFPADLTLQGDFELIKRVLVNLLSNAVKFTPEGGRISVEAGRHDGATRICVRDTGVGIPEDQLDRLFDKFAQVEPADGRRRQGTGLGLAFVRLAVESHGGTVSVESTIGKGSTFCFTIPDRPAETAGDTK